MRKAFAYRLGSGIVRPICGRTWQRWRQRARQGRPPYASFVAEITHFVRDGWRR